MSPNIVSSSFRHRFDKRLLALLILTAPIWTNATRGPAEPGQKVIVHIPAEGGETAVNHAISELNGVVVADRGSFAVLEIPTGRIEAASQMEGVVIRRDFDQIMLARTTLNTRAARGRGDAISGLSIDIGLKIVQLAAPAVDEDLEDLAATGVEVVSYIPQNAYLVWAGDATEAQALRTLVGAHPMFQFGTDWLPEYAMSRSLRAHDLSERVVGVSVAMFRPAEWTSEDELDAVMGISMFAEHAEVDLSFGRDGKTIRMGMRMPGDALPEIIENPTVLWVEPVNVAVLGSERQAQLLAGNLAAGGAEPSGPSYLQWLDSWDFPTAASSYPIVALVDDGLDNGTTSPSRAVFSGSGRIAFSQLHPGNTEDPAPAPVGRDAHGDVNATIMIGYDTSSGEDEHEDAEGFNFGLGVSPYGRIGNLKVFGVQGVAMGDLVHSRAAIEASYSAGARISNNSWGAAGFFTFDLDDPEAEPEFVDFPAGDGWSFWGGAGGLYTSLSEVYDERTRDALPGTGGNQEMLFVFITHNQGPNPGTVMPPGTAKNVLTVGGSETFDIYARDIEPDESHTGEPEEVVDGAECHTRRKDGDDARDIAAFSGAGPCDVLRSDTTSYPIWINEFHYDDGADPDTNEFVEIAGPAGTSLEGWLVWAYDPSTTTQESNAEAYDQIELSGVIPNQENCMGTLAFSFPGLRDGQVVALALMNPRGDPVHFVSTHAFVPENVDPPVPLGLGTNDNTGTNIHESGSTPAGHSVYLTGGVDPTPPPPPGLPIDPMTVDPFNSRGDFSWTTGTATPNEPNVEQFFWHGCGRVKPDIVAPATFLFGVTPPSCPSPSAGGVCGRWGHPGPTSGTCNSAHFPEGQGIFTWSSGTSHAAPAIAGYAQLVWEYLGREYGISNPSPALLKAYILHSGRHLTGSGANDNFPSNSQGYGIADMGFGFQRGAARFMRNQEAADLVTQTGIFKWFKGVVDRPTQPFRASLVWTDPPASPMAGAALVNNLDLVVLLSDRESTETLLENFRGNNFDLDESVATGSYDTLNNVECVFLPEDHATFGDWPAVDLRVLGTQICGDGLPGNGDSTDQDFALVVYNMRHTPGPTNALDVGPTDSKSVTLLSGAMCDDGEFSTPYGVKYFRFIGPARETGSASKTLTITGAPTSSICTGIPPIEIRNSDDGASSSGWSATNTVNYTHTTETKVIWVRIAGVGNYTLTFTAN